MSRAGRRRLKRALARTLPTAVIEIRGGAWVRVGAFLCRLLPLPLAKRHAVMRRVFLSRFQYRTRLGSRVTQWRPVTKDHELVALPAREA